MRSINKIILLFIFFAIGGCSDYLEEEPLTDVSIDFLVQHS
jgi:hypothetical protein